MSETMTTAEVRYCELESCDKEIVKTRRLSVAAYQLRRFCSRECAAEFARAGRAETPRTKVCEGEWCRAEFTFDESVEKWPAFRNRRYCSVACRQRGRAAAFATKARERRGGWTAENDAGVEGRRAARQKLDAAACDERAVFGKVDRVWRPEGFSEAPVIPERIRRWNEENAA